MIGIIEYFKRVTGFVPTPEQCELLLALVDDSIEKLAVSCGRGFSKTLCGAVVTLWYAEGSIETTVPIKVMIASPQDTLYEYVNQYFVSEVLREHRVKKGVYTEVPIEGFELDNGTKIFTKPATNKVRSNRADILILDETADIPEAIVKSASLCLTGNKPNRIIMISTPHKSGYFTTICGSPSKYGYVLKQWSCETCPWCSKTVKRSKSMLTLAEYAIEIQGRIPTKSERQLFASKHIAKCVFENVVKEGSPGSRLEMGIDWGSGRSPIVGLVTEKLFSRRKVLAIKTWSTRNMSNCFKELGDMIVEWNPSIVKADSMPPEFRGKVEPYCKGYKIHYIHAQFCKDEMIGQLKHKVQLHHLEIDERFVDLIKQLRKYRRGLQYGDDLVDVLALSIYEPSTPLSTKPQGKVIFSSK